MTRALLWGRSWLVAIDQLLYVTLAGPFYLVGLAALPAPQETISSIVGRKSLDGRHWARVVERLLDGLFEALGDGPGHCRRSIIPL